MAQFTSLKHLYFVPQGPYRLSEGDRGFWKNLFRGFCGQGHPNHLSELFSFLPGTIPLPDGIKVEIMDEEILLGRQSE